MTGYTSPPAGSMRLFHRTRTQMMGAFILLLFTLLTVGTSLVTPTATASASPISACPQLHVVVVPGTLDSSMGRDPHDQRSVLAPTIADAQRGLQAGTVQTTYVPYPADFGYTSGGTPYAQSVAVGVAATNSQIAQVYQHCGQRTQIAIVGYSQGAEVAHRVAVSIGSNQGPVPAAQIRGVYLISDPLRTAGGGVIPGAPGTGAPLNGAWTTLHPTSDTLGQGMPMSNNSFGSLTGRVASLCMTGDFACSIPQDAQAVRIIANVAEQVHIDTAAPLQIAADVATTVIKSGTRTLAYGVTTPGWLTSAEALGSVIEKTTDPCYVGPEITDITAKDAAAFLGALPTAAAPKLWHDLNAAVRDNLGLVTMASHPDYWYPGPSHTSYFSRPADPSGQTSAQYVSNWIRESAVSPRPSNNVTPPTPTADPSPTPLPDPVADAGQTVVASTRTLVGAAEQLPDVARALTAEATTAARGTPAQAQVAAVANDVNRAVTLIETAIPSITATAHQTLELLTPHHSAVTIGAHGVRS